jgi:tRNA(Ile)-lysidine synthetase-like protein
MEQYATLPEEARIAVRHRRAGDRYEPVNGAARKIKDLLIDAGIPQCMKECIPLLTIDGEPAWLAGWRIAERFKTRAGGKVWRLTAITRAQARAE